MIAFHEIQAAVGLILARESASHTISEDTEVLKTHVQECRQGLQIGIEKKRGKAGIRGHWYLGRG
jgi:hypothetical protein